MRVFWSAQGGARIAVPRCSRVYIWSAQTRRLSVRVHQNHTLRSTLLTADIISRHQHSDGAHAQRRTQIRSDIRESGTGACGTVSAHTMAHHSSECRVWQPLARNCSRYCNFGQRFPEVQVLCQTHSMDVPGWRRAGQLVSASVPCVLGARPPRPRGPHRCVFNNPIIPTLTSSSTSSPDEARERVVTVDS